MLLLENGFLPRDESLMSPLASKYIIAAWVLPQAVVRQKYCMFQMTSESSAFTNAEITPFRSSGSFSLPSIST